MMKRLFKQGLELSQRNHLPILIATLFSVIAIIGGFSDIAYVPLNDDRRIDITIVAVMFASMIGGYRVAIPLAVTWTLVTHFNLDLSLDVWPLWAILLVRIIFAVSIVWFYQKFKVVFPYSPSNVYRAIFVSVIIKNALSVPFDALYLDPWGILRAEQMIIEMGLCMVFMSLLIKHLRQIHILNGVKKKKKGEMNNAN